MALIKRILKAVVKKALIISSTRKNVRLIKSKIKYLNNNNLLIRFPAGTKSTISNSPFHQKSDRMYYDFFYSVSGIESPDYIPLTVYYNIIEPALNNIQQLRALKDKNFIDLFFNNTNSPRTFLRKINGAYVDRHFNPVIVDDQWLSDNLSGIDKLILKPSIDSGAGKSIMLFFNTHGIFVNDSNTILNLETINSYADFVLQEFVVQHEFFRNFNSSSNNTVRIFTYRSVISNKVHILHRLLRIGKPGKFLDHDNHGGIAVGISDLGHLNDFGTSIAGEKFQSFNGISFSYTKEVPFIKEMERISNELASKIFYGRLLAFDFTVDNNEAVLLLEVNAWRNGISQYQMNNGSLFGKFTEEILEYCRSSQRNHLIEL